MVDTSFYSAELARSLKEQQSRVRSTAPIASTNQEATAAIHLLEGTSIVVRLTAAGYEVVGRPQTRHYETLDDLLLAESSQYAHRGMELLFSKLEHIRLQREAH
ncbi:hypothetical protein AURDEDRAFT_115509 [Auricularia subglabra TFB-10046 SS5]|nr:hypothetical protein AURDEDRAFT_115509 [Auricularia subglabra TFB-10046 SS5]